MNRMILRLLSLAEEADFIRLVLSKRLIDQITIEVEGGGPGDEQLARRVAAAFETEMNHGFEFEVQPPDKTTHPSTGYGRALEIVPRARSIRSERASVGFNPKETEIEDEPRGSQIFVPAFPTFRCATAASFLPTLLGHPTATRVEVEFTRWSLPADWLEPLEQARQSHGSVHVRADGAASAEDLEVFLNRWLSNRTGWDVRLRVFEGVFGVRIPDALLELVGGDFYRAPCEVRDLCEGRRQPDQGRIVDLSTRFPVSWTFPEILPAESCRDRLSARKKYNLSIPPLPREGAVIGMVEEFELRLPVTTRDRHTYIAGATGTGKSTLIKKLIREDLEGDAPLVLLDPHGDLFREVVEMVPDRRRGDLFVIDPGSEVAPAFNFLRLPRDRFLRRRVEFLVGELIRFFQETWRCPEAFGPIFELYFRNGMLLLLLQDRIPVTVLDFARIFSDEEFRTRLIAACDADDVEHFWKTVAVRTSGDVSLANVTPYIVSKMQVLCHGGFLTEMIRQQGDDVRLEERINSRSIVLVNLDKGLLGPAESRLLGVLLTMQLFTAGLKRSLTPPSQRQPVNVYIDEFQNFVSENIGSMLSEARKFGLRLHLANQTLSQLSGGCGGHNLLESVLGNVGNLILFRLGVIDAERLESHFDPFTRQQMQELRNFHALARILTDDGPVRPLIMNTLP